MLETFRKGQRWLTSIFILVIGGVFVFFLGLGGSPMSGSQPAGQAVVEVGDIVVSRADYLRQRATQEERLREALGDQLDSKGADQFISSQTLRVLVDSAVMSHAAQEVGLMVTRKEIGDYLRGTGQFRDGGRFDRKAFSEFAKWNYGSEANFMALVRQDLLRAKLRRLIYNQPTVTEAEAQNAALYRLEGVQLGYVSIDSETLLSPEILTNEAVETYLAENEPDVRAIYQEREDVYRKPEARKARHILFVAARTAGDEALATAKKRAEDAMQEIVDGAAFEDVAREFSEDESSRVKGGDIGYLVRAGESLRELEDAVYEIEPGGEMRVIQTDAGFHVVRVDEKREAANMPFEAVSLEIARELAGAHRAKEYAEGLADQLADAVRDGQSLRDAASAAGALYRYSPTIRRRADGYMPEIGTSTDMMAMAFSLTKENSTSPRVFAIAEQRILIELIDRVPPDPVLLEDQAASEQETLLSEKRDAMFQAWMRQHRDSLNANNQLLIDTSITQGS